MSSQSSIIKWQFNNDDDINNLTIIIIISSSGGCANIYDWNRTHDTGKERKVNYNYDATGWQVTIAYISLSRVKRLREELEYP